MKPHCFPYKAQDSASIKKKNKYILGKAKQNTGIKQSTGGWGAFRPPVGAPAHPCGHQPGSSTAGFLDKNYILLTTSNAVIFERQD